jgi:uncharacterized membrane protein YhaH (DUF805 family)
MESEVMDYRLLFLDFHGRIARKWYWYATLIAALVSFVLNFLTGLFQQWETTTVTVVRDGREVSEAVMATPLSNPVNLSLFVVQLLFGLAFLYATFAIQTKRLHDRGKSGWWNLIGFVPVVGAIYLFIVCGFLRGDAGPNRYGSDPLVDPVAALDGNPVVEI